MRTLTLLAAMFCVLFVTAGEASGQAGRVLKFIRIPPPRPVVPAGRWNGLGPVVGRVLTSNSSGSGSSARPSDTNVLCNIMVVFGILVLLFVGCYLMFGRRKARARSRLDTPNNAASGMPPFAHSRKPASTSWSKGPTNAASGMPPFSQSHPWAGTKPRMSPIPSLEDLILSQGEVEEKAEQTTRLLGQLALHDPLFNPSSLKAFMIATFLQLQRCWEERDYGPVRDLLAPSLLAEHEALLQVMRRDRLINRLEGLSVRWLEFIHVCHAEAKDGHEVTAMITFGAGSYYVDDRSGVERGGLRKVIPFQEFWTFRRQGDGWQLYTIQRDESVHLEVPNYVAPLTEVTR